MTDVQLSDSHAPAQSNVQVLWGIKVPLRDGVLLDATVYMPNDKCCVAAIVTLTPYTSQTWHTQGMYFAASRFVFVAVDVRGRGNSGGDFFPLKNEADDAFDVIEWISTQPFCNGSVGMWGGSYGGHVQWAAAGRGPRSLRTIVPVASPCIGIDFPTRNNLPRPYWIKWLTLVRGRTAQDKVFWGNDRYWAAMFRKWHESGASFAELDSLLGSPSEIFQEWLSHPEQDAYWDSYNPTSEQYASINIPVLTITGCYDGDQPGALAHYRRHLEYGGSGARSTHYLIIGPWDHAGTRVPRLNFCGLTFGPNSLLDLLKLHVDWYAWTLGCGDRPAFLKKSVAYYVMGADCWRYADGLDEITRYHQPLYMRSDRNPIDIYNSGSLLIEPPLKGEPDSYCYDPRDHGLAAIEALIDADDRTDDRMVHLSYGKNLIYHTQPLEEDCEISGFFKLRIWIAIDCPDTDFRAAIYEVTSRGTSILLTADSIRARYREGLRSSRLVRTEDPLQYEFNGFTFVSREVKKGHRLRLVVGPNHSIYSQRNGNSGGAVAHERLDSARAVTVRIFHDPDHPSVLYVPFAALKQDA